MINSLDIQILKLYLMQILEWNTKFNNFVEEEIIRNSFVEQIEKNEILLEEKKELSKESSVKKNEKHFDFFKSMMISQKTEIEKKNVNMIDFIVKDYLQQQKYDKNSENKNLDNEILINDKNKQEEEKKAFEEMLKVQKQEENEIIKEGLNFEMNFKIAGIFIYVIKEREKMANEKIWLFDKNNENKKIDKKIYLNKFINSSHFFLKINYLGLNLKKIKGKKLTGSFKIRNFELINANLIKIKKNVDIFKSFNQSNKESNEISEILLQNHFCMNYLLKFSKKSPKKSKINKIKMIKINLQIYKNFFYIIYLIQENFHKKNMKITSKNMI